MSRNVYVTYITSAHHSVALVDEFLELVGVTAARRRGEEVSHVVPKGGVVGVLLNGHELDCVVTQAFDTRQHLFPEKKEKKSQMAPRLLDLTRGTTEGKANANARWGKKRGKQKQKQKQT